ncbi:ABC transporter permease [Tautonia plasticadhaerens]|uniref:ABC-2 family transporter protein n=1 Tax=Tautonia plasticadhaerens TaxID=2527974 RepID=A0A518H2S8_9BACT|nr:ABC transporter permease [Tautonia plasticadhaerens]QDV35146.1 ABC-2 family transporter protein [Tautonia plasticadhaerens]
MPRSSLWQLYVARLREFYRQPARIFWVYGFPIVLAVVLGLAFNSGGEPETVVVDVVDSGEARTIFGLLGAAAAPEGGRVGVVMNLIGPEEASLRLQRGQTPLVVESTGPDAVEYRYDPTRPEALAARAAFDDAYQRALGRVDVAETTESIVDDPGSRYIDFLIPGLIGVNAMGGGLWGVGFLLVNFRIGKLLKRFQATPMPRRNFLLAVLGARLTFLIPDLLILLSLGVFGFGMPVRGNLGLVVLMDVVGALAFAGIGLLIASRAQTTETVSGLMNLVMIPMWLFSGVFFSYERFPDAMLPFIKLLPLTQLVDGLRRVVLEGAGILEVGPNLIVLGAWAVASFLVALRIFRWS